MTPPGIDPAPLLALVDELDAAAAGERLGVCARTVSRWRNGRTRIQSMWAADRLACAVGMHPGDLWPGYHDWLPVAHPSLFDDPDDLEDAA